MAARSLNPDEAEIWAKVAATVRRMEGRAVANADRVQRVDATSLSKAKKLAIPSAGPLPQQPQKTPSPEAPGEHLDGGWDRRLRKGMIAPDRSVDLHGHNLAGAHHALDMALERAVADGIRMLLVITGKPPRDPVPHRRGLIRAAIGDWLASSRHAGRIAAIRNAHPRHGGSGALYIILRRARTG